MQTELAAILLTLAFLLILVSLVQPLAKRLEIPETVLIAASGIILGLASTFVVNSMGFDLFEGAAEELISFPINSEGFLLIFLPLLVFQGAMAIDVRSLAHEAGTVLLLAIVAVGVSTALIGYALHPFSDQSLVVCLLLGSIVATTDPSAIAGIFRQVGAASRLSRLVEGEALLNDAAAIAIFSILLSAVIAHQHIHFGEAALDFAEEFSGALVIGAAAARLMLVLISLLGTFPAAEATLTLALPYVVYIACEDILGFSGVVATAAAGLVVSGYGPSTFRPQVWNFLEGLWEQLAFWAGSLVFMLAALFVPRLMIGLTPWDWILIGIACLAGLIARSSVIFGLLPVLSFTGTSPSVPTPFKITMAWGGLRGAITLALALAVTENHQLPQNISHFVGIIATGFVLVTLVINGTTLRWLVVYLKLDQLSPVDAALRNQVIGIGLGQVSKRVESFAKELGFSLKARRTVLTQLGNRAARVQELNNFETALTERNKVTLALLTLANQEKTILLDLFRIPGLTGRHVMETLLRSSEAMIDGARSEGRYGYIMARKKRLQASLRFRIAEILHHCFHIDGPLMHCMKDRFEMLVIVHLVTTALLKFVSERMQPTLGTRITEIVMEVLERQRKVMDQALEGLRSHYPGYAESLENKILRQIALRLEDEEYAHLAQDNLISPDLRDELHRTIEKNRIRLQTPIHFELRSGIFERLRQFPVFNGVPDVALNDLARHVSLRFLPPSQPIFIEGQKIQTVYAQLSGLVILQMRTHEIQLKTGSILGALGLLHGGRAIGTLRTVHYTHLLAISHKIFEDFVQSYPIVRRHLMKEAPREGTDLLTDYSSRAVA